MKDELCSALLCHATHACMGLELLCSPTELGLRNAKLTSKCRFLFTLPWLTWKCLTCLGAPSLTSSAASQAKYNDPKVSLISDQWESFTQGVDYQGKFPVLDCAMADRLSLNEKYETTSRLHLMITRSHAWTIGFMRSILIGRGRSLPFERPRNAILPDLCLWTTKVR